MKENGGNNSSDVKSIVLHGGEYLHIDNGEEHEDTDSDNIPRNEDHPIDLPLEVITTVQPFDFSYPVLKNMSNGIFTHRNIFTDAERELLTNIVDKYRDIVDTRSRTREIYTEKQNVWQQIVEEYNNMENVVPRTEKELRKCWDNMKYRARIAAKEKLKNVKIINNVGKAQYMSSEQDNYSTDIKERNSSDASRVSDNGSSRNGSDEDDEGPLFKKARQESPKLSSLLLGEKQVSATLQNYAIPNCTKVLHKKRLKKPPVSILPKSDNSNLNYLQKNKFHDISSQNGSISLGGGVTISPHISHINSLGNSVVKQINQHCNGNNYSDVEGGPKVDLECKIMLKKYEMEEKEHQLRLKVLEKQAELYSNESLYWSYKLKILKNGTDSSIYINGNA